MFIEVRLEESQAEFIRDHFDNLRQKESYHRNDSGALGREYKYSQIVGRFEDAFLENQVRRIQAAKDRSRTSCASSEERHAES